MPAARSPSRPRLRSSVLTATLFLAFGLLTDGPARAAKPAATGRAAKVEYQKRIQPLLSRYCYTCHDDDTHKGGISLEAFQDAEAIERQRDVWQRVLRKLRAYEMPPPGRQQPPPGDRARIVQWIETELFPVDPAHPDPGRVTLRRLNRAEYSNTIRDLVGVDVRPADDFPADDSGYGFDNIGDVLSMSPLLLEKYLAAAEKILGAAIVEHPDGRPLPETHRRIFVCQPTLTSTNECARVILSRFARRAFRRPVTPNEVERLSRLAAGVRKNGATFEMSIQVALEAVLVSPHFLFLGEAQPDPDNPRVTRPLDEFALASRLSYFLWSSMPDDELFALAEKRRLRKNLRSQVERMLQDPKSRALAENFGGQWLQTRNLRLITPDPARFPAFDDDLRAAMQQETRLFFENIVREDRSILDLLNADYTFVNERLARFYGLDGVTGTEFRRCSLVGTPRRGVLTQASVLAVTSNPTRTSPVKRGKWVLENLLGEPPPPPPPGVPPLREAKEDNNATTVRQRMERHREDPLCASCHARMDPLGFALENFDAIGAWREKDGPLPIDASGELPSGQTFSGPAGLREILAGPKRDQFARCLTEKLLTYALGRGLEYYDQPTLDRIVGDLAKQDYRFSSLVLGVAQSVPFQNRRGDRAADVPAQVLRSELGLPRDSFRAMLSNQTDMIAR